MAFKTFYLEALKAHGFKPSTQQESVFEHFDALENYIQSRWFTRLIKAQEYGLYIWGDVGRGKSFLSELFLDYLKVPCQRFHLHSMMQSIEQHLSQNSQSKALQQWVKEHCKSSSIVLIDEFVVNDIATAMQLQRLLQVFAEQKIVLLMTSNFAPDDLYQGGLQRQRFLPTIQWLKAHFRVVHLGGEKDYRFEALLEYAEHEHNAESLEKLFHDLAPTHIQYQHPIKIAHRKIPTRALSDSVVWLDFDVLFGDGRSTKDYLEMAQLFQIVLVTDTPSPWTDEDNDVVRRFIHAIDAFYESQVKVIWQELLDDHYHGKKLQAEWVRAQSRLKLMHSKHYWAKPHLPQSC